MQRTCGEIGRIEFWKGRSSAMRLFLAVLIITLVASFVCCGGEDSGKVPPGERWSVRIADSFLLRHPGAVTYDSGMPDQKWTYEQGLMLVALLQMSLHNGEQKYFDFVSKNLDQYVEENGTIRTYKRTDYNLDNVAPGRALLAVYQSTKQQKYRAAADSLRRQLREQPRTHEGGFWHKKIYPYQMWLDGLFMAEPFYALYAVLFDEPKAFDDIANQFIWIASHTRDPKTGLFYHGWDESRQQRWANPETGCSPSFWGRAMGWYAMGLVDVLDYFPADHPKRKELISILRGLSDALLRCRDEKTFLWYQVVDQGQREGNYLESSASCMFAYTFAKGANRGYLDKTFLEAAGQSLGGVTEHLVTINEDGFVDLHQTCKGSGLGGNPYRDGSYSYYVSELRRTNDMKGIGPFLLAAIEIERGMATKKSGGMR
jgi:unsaturated rhamnogalacturonyl hydrolase